MAGWPPGADSSMAVPDNCSPAAFTWNYIMTYLNALQTFWWDSRASLNQVTFLFVCFLFLSLAFWYRDIFSKSSLWQSTFSCTSFMASLEGG